MKDNKIEKIIFIGFFILGFIFTVVGTIICIKTFNYTNKIETTGKITRIVPHTDIDGETSYETYVSYVVGEEEYNTKLNVYSSTYYVGKEIKIYYDINNHHNIGTRTSDIFLIIFPAMGLIFMCVGGIPLIKKKVKQKEEERLRESGTRVEAQYVETIIRSNYNVNGKSPYIIICEWTNPADNKNYVFKSKNLWEDPEPIIEQQNIEKIPVYIDLNNTKKYVIDLDRIFINKI